MYAALGDYGTIIPAWMVHPGVMTYVEHGGVSELRRGFILIGFYEPGENVPSLAFEVRKGWAWGDFVFEGRGQGHGAGLCQWGAAGLAREGKTYREILAHYYPGVDVVRMY